MEPLQLENGRADDTPYLLKLPRELRDRIYDLTIVVSDAGIEQPLCLITGRVAEEFGREKVQQCIRTYMALSKTCRQIHREVETSFYGKNTFGAFVDWVIGGKPLEGLDCALRHIHRLVLYRGDDIGDWTRSDPQLPACILDLRIRGKIIRSEIMVAAAARENLQDLLGAQYHGLSFDKITVAPDEFKQSTELKLGPALEALRSGLQMEGYLTRGTLIALGDGVIRAW